MNWLLLTILGAVAEGEVLIRRGRSIVGADPSELTPAGSFTPATMRQIVPKSDQPTAAITSGCGIAPTSGSSVTTSMPAGSVR